MQRVMDSGRWSAMETEEGGREGEREDGEKVGEGATEIRKMK